MISVLHTMSPKSTINNQQSTIQRAEHTFVGFGFGPIQAGLFAKEAFQSGNFRRIVVAEIDQRLVEAVRSSKGAYHVNIAGSDRIETARIEGIELLNPMVPEDATALRSALSEATEVTTCLPSVDFYDLAGDNSVAALIAGGWQRRKTDATIVYAAENHNHAAEILEQTVAQRLPVAWASRPWVAGPSWPCLHGRDARDPMGKMPMLRVQFLNTVIGKMSQVVTDPREMADRNLLPIAPGIDRAFLVEEFNRILVSKTTIPDFVPGIRVFLEKDDLLPFEEAKLYGHNAIHALLGFIGMLKGYAKMTELASDAPLMSVARAAFLRESGGALIRKHASLGDELFTEAGYRHYTEDLLERMTNPYLADTVARAARDVVRKLGVSDRIFGTMALALEYGIEPKNMALGAMAGVALLLANAAEHGLPQELRSLNWQRLSVESLTQLLTCLWQRPMSPSFQKLIDCTHAAVDPLVKLLA
jgi:mannitol-1-phosphate 5-dehydrogenase